MRTVLKIGGSVLEPEPNPELLRALVQLVEGGEELVIVHGGGQALTGLLRRLGVPTEFRQGLRVTDAPTLKAAVMAFAGEVNAGLVARLNAEGRGGIAAVGLTGADAGCVAAQPRSPELGFVGEISSVATKLLRHLLAGGFTPVLAPLASDGQGGLLNVNADQFAAACAASLAADRVIFVTDVAGVLDPTGAAIPHISMTELRRMVGDGAISGGMLPKMEACHEALNGGVGWVEIIGAPAACALGCNPSASRVGTRVTSSNESIPQ